MSEQPRVTNTLKTIKRQLIIAWPGRQITVPLDKPIMRFGRSEKNDVVVKYPVISRHHATLKLEGDSYRIIDGQHREGHHQPSGNGLYFCGQRVTEHLLQNGDILRIPDQAENFITLMYFDSSAPPSSQTDRVSLNHEVTVGRSPNNDLALNDPLASSYHMVISPTGQGHVLQDLKSSNGTYVNGQRVTTVTLNVGDLIQAGSTQLRYDGTQLIPADRRDGIRLDAIEVRKQVQIKKGEYKVLLDGISLVIHPREFVSLVGVSGAGKSTLLDAMNGSRRAEGKILINGKDLYEHFDAYRHNIGYVPQDDIIHRDLTVAEALTYVARLRLPSDTPQSEIEARVNTVLEQVAMAPRKHVLIKDLSGGQRKRVSIAVELIADPGIIFLDEPTSGLDPGLDKKMMFTLKQLAHAGKTVILVTHATGNITDCNLVAFLAVGGRLVYYGPPAEALAFFEVKDFAEIYNTVELEPEEWIKKFKTSSYYEQYVQHRLRLPSSTHSLHPTRMGSESGDSLATKVKNSLRQMFILTHRYLTILLKDRRNLLLLLGQAPLVALLLFLVIGSDSVFDPCTPAGYTLDEKGALFVNAEGKRCSLKMEDVSRAQRILFVVACVAIWLGVFSASREIVKELTIYRRERLVNLSIPAYVGSKLAVLLGLSIFQAAILVGMLHLWSGFPARGVLLPGPLEILVTVLLLTFTAACFGLFLSAVVGREDRIMSVMPVFLILQIVFAGIVFRVTPFAEHPTTFGVSLVTFSRWGIEAMGATINMPALWNALKYGGGQQGELPFRFSSTPEYLLQNWAILVGFILLSIILTLVALKRQDVH
jgi:ABC-type multidrug transport system ATPase subunit/pSer/pThr/pTyr-binding forkhead associated (FHA) protein